MNYSTMISKSKLTPRQTNLTTDDSIVVSLYSLVAAAPLIQVSFNNF